MVMMMMMMMRPPALGRLSPEVKALSGSSTPLVAPELVTFEDIAVPFSAEEWSLLEGWQKQLHKDVMLESCALLISLSNSRPSAEASSLVHQLEGAMPGQNFGQAGREDGTPGEDHEFPAATEGPWDVTEMRGDREGDVTPTAGEGNDACRSSLHLCALMKLVKEIPEFLYGHAKAPLGPVANPNGKGAEGTTEEPQGEAKVAGQTGIVHLLGLTGDLADVSFSPETPTSSTEEEWVESQAPGGAKPEVEVTGEEERLAPGWKENNRVHRGSPSANREAEPCTRSPAVEAQATVGRPLAHSVPAKTRERPGRPRSPSAHHQDQDQATDPPSSSSSSSSRSAKAMGQTTAGGEPLPPVKIEASEEELCGHRPGSTGKEGPGPPVAQAANTEGGGTAMAPPRKDGRLPAAVKTERMSCSPPLWHPDGPRNALACLGATDQQRLPDEAAVLGVRIKREPEAKEEELPLRGLKGSSEEGEEEEEEDEEEGSLPCSLPHRGSSCSSVESRAELGLWVPYSEEWSPATSPLHGLLNCLKEIPTPKQPRASKTGPERRGGGGGGEMRKGGRSRRLELHREWAVPEKMGALSSQSHTLPVPNTCGPAREDLPSRGTRDRPDPQLLPWPGGPASSNRGRDAAELQKSGPQVTRGGTPLESLARCLKGLPLNAPSHPCSPAVSSSLGSSPERLLSGTPERGRRARKGDGLGRESSTPLQGLEKCLQELPLGSPIQTPSPVVSSSFGSSPDRCHRWTPEAGRWARKEPGGGSGSTPLQGLERCLKELPLGSPGHLPLSPALRAFFGSFPDGRHRWTPEAGRWARNEGGAVSSGIPPLQGLENCLKEIALSRNPLSHSASSSCTQRPREGEGLLQGPQARGGPAGSPLQRLPVVGPSGSTCSGARAESSPLRRLMTCLEGVPIRRPSYLDTPSASSSSSSSPSSSSSSSSSCSETEREQEGPRSGACSSCSQEDAWSTPRSQEDAPAAAAAATTTPTCAQSCSDTSAQAPLGRTSERDAEWSCLERRVQCSHAEAKQKLATRNRCPQSVTHSLGETPTGPLKAGSTRTDSAPKEWDAHRGTSSVEGGGTSESSPLRGLLRCLKEITARGPSPGSLSASRSPAAEGRCQQAREEEAATRASGEGPAPTSPADGVQGSSPEGNRCLPLSNGSPPTPTSCARRPSEPQAQRSGVKRSFPTARNEDGPPSGTRPCSTGSQGKEDPGTPSKKKCASPGLPSPRHSYGSGKSLESKAEQGDVGPVLSRKLDRLSADMSAICRDVAQLQSHLDRLEQEARGWGLELATLRMENRSLSEYVRRMEGRCRSLENRSRRNNLRMLGLPEGAEGSDPLSFLQKTLPEMLALPEESRPLEVESARRVNGGVAWDPNGRPRPLVFRLLRFADKAAILQAAQARHLSYAGTQVTILPDFCSSLSQRRRFPVRAFRRTRWLADLCFGPRHASFCRPWVQGWREPALATSRPLAGEREGRAPKGPEDRNTDPSDPLAGSGRRRGCLSPESCEQHNP